MFQTNVVENIKTHILCSVFCFFENRSDYEIMWKNIACWIPRTTIHALRLCNTHCFSTTTVVSRTSLNVTFHVQCLSCYRYVVFVRGTYLNWVVNCAVRSDRMLMNCE